MCLRRSLAAVILLTLFVWGPVTWVEAADNFAELFAAVQAANSGGTGAISLNGDIVLTAPLPPITGAITIEGNGNAISGDHKFRIFDVSGGRLTVNNLTLTRGSAERRRRYSAAKRRNSHGDECQLQSKPGE